MCVFVYVGLWDIRFAPPQQYRTTLCSTNLCCAAPTCVVHHGAQGRPISVRSRSVYVGLWDLRCVPLQQYMAMLCTTDLRCAGLWGLGCAPHRCNRLTSVRRKECKMHNAEVAWMLGCFFIQQLALTYYSFVLSYICDYKYSKSAKVICALI